jgi:hypothetical protein
MPGLKVMQMSLSSFLLKYHWMLLHYSAARLHLTVSQTPVKERNAFPAKTLELCAVHLLMHDVEPARSYAPAAAVLPCSLFCSPCTNGTALNLADTWGFIDYHFDRDDFRRRWGIDLSLLAQHVLSMRNSRGKPTNASGEEFPLAEWNPPPRDVRGECRSRIAAQCTSP